MTGTPSQIEYYARALFSVGVNNRRLAPGADRIGQGDVRFLRRIFGHRMVHTKLAATGVEVSVGTVAAIMAENGWAAKWMRAFKRTTRPSDPDKVFADLFGRDFTSDTPGTKLVGDITYLRTGEGWLYLTTVIDLCTRMIVGWAMAGHMRAAAMRYIEVFYNRWRPHTNNDGLPPATAMANFKTKNQPLPAAA
jgi:transposase InsO family protein